jgi:hypothetical protein
LVEGSQRCGLADGVNQLFNSMSGENHEPD